MVKKHTGEDPFDAPAAVVEATAKGPFGPYVHEPFGEIPVDFLADLDITGGNSGSATLNARGELIGLVFDGNYEAMASDWIFMPDITRSIHVDIRYVLWLMDRVHQADHLLKEMGIEPRL
jgi:S1-C subfamily serine protease